MRDLEKAARLRAWARELHRLEIDAICEARRLEHQAALRSRQKLGATPISASILIANL